MLGGLSRVLLMGMYILKRFSLTLGLMGLDELHLRVLATSSEDAKEKANAQKGAHSISQCIGIIC